MSKEIVVNKGEQTRIAIVENGDLAELFIENQEHERTIGNIFLGRVRRIMPSIQAAFVDIGQKQDAFLHFSDLIENVEDWMRYAGTDRPVIGKFEGNYTTKPAKKKRRHPSGSQDRRGRGNGSSSGDHHHVADEKSRDKRKFAQQRQHGRRDSSHDSRGGSDDVPMVDPTTFLKKDQPILVKISKEPIANKGSRITTDISLAGRFLVLVPMANYVAVSKKIMSFKERRRLRALAKSLLPEGFGVIVRTVADGRSAKALDTDLNLLIDKWKKLEQKMHTGPKPPSVVHEDVNMVSSIMRDLFTEDYDRILIDDQRLYRNLKGYVQAIAPQLADNVIHHQDEKPVFEKVGIANAVQEAFEDRVNLPSGGYLFIEQTEAMHVIDVNSGRAGRGLSQEENSLRVNIESARVLCKQVRLRDLGGIIVVDFIDMRNDRNRRKVYDALKTEFRKDRAVTKVLPMSDFGLIQITRQRLRPSITKTFSLPEGGEKLPLTHRDKGTVQYVDAGHARIEPVDLRSKVEEWIADFKNSGLGGKVRLVVHPFTALYFKEGLFSTTFKWYLKYGVRVKVEEDSKVDPLSFQFFEVKSGKNISKLPRKPQAKKEGRKPQTDNRRGSKGAKRSHDSRDGGERKGRSSSQSSNSGRGRRRPEGAAGGGSSDSNRRGRGADSTSRDGGRGDSRRDDSRRSDSRRSDSSSRDGGRDDSRRDDSRRDDSRRDDSRRDDSRRDDSRR
ncbi:MAG: Rne/Rng family ribonuclease, partial [Bacteroidetes Order II. Incertae sedis bacterium]|nr:Rne/Rng family ribonuclease [Bacteroidetes Order II. bacterium]